MSEVVESSISSSTKLSAPMYHLALKSLPYSKSISFASSTRLPLQIAKYSKMAQASPFTGAVVSSMRRLYPEVLAEKSFDNTGLLLEAPFQPRLPRKNNSVLLTIDLTRAVADEAIDGNHSIVVAYHPIIFRGLKAITLADSQQSSLLRLAANGISVYSPHTAVDITPGGMADWLCDIVAGKLDDPEPEAYTAQQEQSRAAKTDATSSNDSKSPVGAQKSESRSVRPAIPATQSYSKPTYISYPQPSSFQPNVIPHNREVITHASSSSIHTANAEHDPSALQEDDKPYSNQNTGAGRLITFKSPQPLSVLISRIATAIGNPKGFQIAIPQSSTIESLTIKTVGLCPGSGSSVLGKASPPPDLLFTGEMSHHEALAVIERGGCVIALGHSNSERGYLEAVMKEKLLEEVQKQWAEVRKETKEKKEDLEDGVKKVLGDESVEIVVSQVDRDPFGIMVLESGGAEDVNT